MSPKQKRKSEYKIPGLIILVALIAAALALGMYGLQQAKPYLNTTASTPTTTIGSNLTQTQSESAQASTSVQESTSSINTSSPT